MARMNPEYSVNTKRYPIVAGLLVTTLLACRGPVESALPAGALAQAHLDARACDQGDPLSCNNLAASFEAGDTVTADPARAAELYDQACTQNAFLACSNLAGLLLEGRGVPADPQRAIQLLDLACTQQEFGACSTLGELYHHGGQIPPDPIAAARYYSVSCDAFMHRGCLGLGQLTLAGALGQPDAHAAMVLFDKACGSGSSAGCAEHGFLLLDGPPAFRNPQRAAERLERACIGDSVAACQRMAVVQRTGEQGMPSDYDAAEFFRRRTCDLGMTEWCEAPRRAVLVRHAEAWKNVEHPADMTPEQLDSLTSDGQQQAAGMAREMAAFSITTLLSSPANRAQQTAAPLATPERPVVIAQALGSIPPCQLADGTMADWSYREAAWRAGRSPNPEGCEALDSYGREVLATLENALFATNGAVVAVTHGDVLAAVGYALLPETPAEALLQQFMVSTGATLTLERLAGMWLPLATDAVLPAAPDASPAPANEGSSAGTP
jgi:TPR repeat protein